MKAIETKFKGATDTRGSRITASDGDGNRISLGYPHELNSTEAHQKAALMLCRKMKWDGELVTGQLKRSYVHVFVDQYSPRQTVVKLPTPLLHAHACFDHRGAPVPTCPKCLAWSERCNGTSA